ncbi:STAS domain-containing protein [Thalassospira alkalitolerans]|uniref:STAS domain-containing protein n=1 Tax=Thalassospira alkalitolerans TaxID=1293890 RepID=UPI000A1F531C|nr:STAS domain-containing protein [Thalassospira alkalitolerans]|tara:strand:+ start:180424 stop:180864 length:441 start_codon:yes stop_codon:yes gene_type:complete
MTYESPVDLAKELPVTLLWDRILMLSIVGVVDSMRSQAIMTAMLTKIEETEARIIILDILGVEVVDTAVANHLIKITQACRLMGCTCIVSGISPAIAQTLVQLGIPLSDVVTRVTIRDALIHAFQVLGLEIKPIALGAPVVQPLRK